MVEVFFKIVRNENGLIKDYQVRGKVIHADNGIITVEYEIDGEKITRVLDKGQYSEHPYYMNII